MEEQSQSGVEKEPIPNALDNLITDLTKESEKLNKTAKRIGVGALIALVILYIGNVGLTHCEGKTIQCLSFHDRSATDYSTFHLISKVITGSFLAAIFYWIFRVCMSSFDQSVRYKKRLHSARFLLYLNQTETYQKADLTERMRSYEIWVKSIDSAFATSKKDDRKLFANVIDLAKEVMILAKQSESQADSRKSDSNEKKNE